MIERFAGAGVPEEKISFERDTYTFNFPGPPSEFLAVFRTYYGPTMNAFEPRQRTAGQAELQAELEALFEARTRARARMPPRFLRPSCASPWRPDHSRRAWDVLTNRQLRIHEAPRVVP